LFVQPKSGGSGDCHVANDPVGDQDATEEALYQAQAGTGLTLCVGGLALGACLGMKTIGKPCAGEPHARFDEGGQVTLTMA